MILTPFPGLEARERCFYFSRKKLILFGVATGFHCKGYGKELVWAIHKSQILVHCGYLQI
jgi:hypothetical protein